MPQAALIRLGSVPYTQAWDWQRQLVTLRQQQRIPDCLLLLEHPPVYTLGRGATLANLRFAPDDPGVELHRIERGGEVTYHAPGQLVGYPILDLRQHQPDLHWYLRQLEQVLLDALGCFGLAGDRLEGLTGVWVEGAKVAAIGIKVSRWVSMHGFALNIDPDLSGFGRIIPCGIADRPVTSLARLRPGLERTAVEPAVVDCFARQFGLQWQELTLDDLLATANLP